MKKIKKLGIKLSKLKLEKKTTVQWMIRLYEMLIKVSSFLNSERYCPELDQLHELH